MRRNKKNVALLFLAFLAGGSNLFAAELSNTKILGAIPQSFENVGIVRYSDMDPNTVIGSEFRREVPVAMPAPTPAMPVAIYIAERLKLDGLAIAVTALTNLDVTASINNSRRNIFRLYVAENNTDDLNQAISSRVDTQKVDHAIYDIYRDNNPENPTYVAFLDETLILVTGNENDITESAPALLRPDSQPAPNWLTLNAVDINSPVLILRHLQYPMASPPGSEVPFHDNFLLGMWISDLSAPILRLEVSTDIPLPEAESYIRMVGAIEALAGPEGMALNLDQTGVANANYIGTLEVLHSENGEHWMDLVFLWMLGIWFTI